MPTPFVQRPPRPRNGYTDDWLVRNYLRHRLPREAHAAIEPALLELSVLAATQLWDAQLADRLNEPVLTQWDAWGNRVDRIELTSVWQEAEKIATRFGLVATPYERRFNAWSRVCQFALVHVFHPVSDLYTCPLAMTDGAAFTLLTAGNQHLIERAVPRLTSRDPARFWTSGQWMTETIGGSDVGQSETRASKDDTGVWRLFGKKWFTSAASSQMALTLARPEGNGPGGRGLALFYVETRDAHGAMNGIRVERLKDKLGSRKVPTAELTLDGCVAQLVGDLTNGTRAIEPMLRITRAWNSVCAASYARFGLGLARDYADKRRAFGAPLADLPLHKETLEEIDAESAGAFVLTFRLLELLGQDETTGLDADDRHLLRLLTPLTKAVTGRQAVWVTSEVIETFGGAGYIEDTGIPGLLRDAQVLPIWEGTTNVLSLDLLLRSDLDAALTVLRRHASSLCATAADTELQAPGAIVAAALAHAERWLGDTIDDAERQSGAQRFAMTVGRSFALALLIDLARQITDPQDRLIATAICRRFSRRDIDQIRT
ncbi:MAG: acyl-CoA dehydrogenase family protein [Pseudomonadales bacterium]|nr:acyl-CoA dehydrogenase family protein [Pseudomonadales bacterium]